MGRETALQQERACASFDCADFSSSLTSTHKQQKSKSLFQRCVLILLVPSLLLGPVHAAPPAVVEPAATPSHSTATTVGQSVGNPILPATAEKFQSETDFTDAGPAPLSFGRFYRSTWGADTSRPAGVLGAAWTHTYSASLRASPALNPVAVTITSAEGYVRTFTQPAGASSWSPTNSADSLTWTPAAWIYRRAEDDSTSQFDPTGKLLSRTARNGWTTRYTYNAAGQLITVSQPATALTYTATGLVETLTLPTGLVLGYTYDAAHRLTGWSNNRGESGSYTLDAMGNRVGEQISNSTGAIAWSTARSINNLNRVAARTEGSNQTDSFGYDANGELVSETNGLNQSTRYGLDPLRRITAITNAANATAALSYNALDAVTQASDFKGVATTYARDAQGHATTETSADIGSRVTQYDALGLPSRIVEGLQAEHTKNARPSTEQKHQDAEARRQRDAGGEKGDKRRRPPSKRPPGYKGPWPLPGIIPLVCPLCEVVEPEPLPGPELCQTSLERRES